MNKPFLIFLLMSASAAAADLTVTAQGVQPPGGAVRFALYAGPDGFRDEKRARLIAVATAANGEARTVFSGLPPGRYALIAYHDQNGNGKLDRFLGMIPSEGYAVSNIPEPSGPPPFDRAAFELPEAGLELTLPLRY